MTVILFRDKGTSLIVSPCSSSRIDNGLLCEASTVSLIDVEAPLAGSKPASAYDEASVMVIGEDRRSLDLEDKDSICMDE